MPRTWRLTRRAETALTDIAVWTLETFGPRQAASYEEDLITCCAEIAAGAALSQDCRRLIDPGLPEPLRFARAGQHFIVFIEDDVQIVIIDFLHARADLPASLAGLAEPSPDKDGVAEPTPPRGSGGAQGR